MSEEERVDDVTGWFAGRLPEAWFTGPPRVTWDRDEILVVGTLPDVDAGENAPEAARREARLGRVKRFRSETRAERMEIAREAQHRFSRKVSWGVRCGDLEVTFTHLSLPVMTRLRLPERHLLDTLVDAGVARSRSDALAWCVKLVAKNEEEWIGSLRDALVQVREARAGGPSVA